MFPKYQEMVKKIFLLLVCFFTAALVYSQKANSHSLPRPKLVVGIVVDQMRWDFLYRYYERYGEGGFKRMLNEGYSCENTYINYVPTVTAIGHTSVYTGAVPAVHGITGNEFIIKETGQKTGCVTDSTVKTIGSTSKAGHASPHFLLTTTITDELRLATNFQSKVIGISLKDRGAIFPAGRAANAAYWYDDLTGNWISSSYYMQQLPGWVNEVNAKGLPAKYLSGDWNTLYPIDSYKQSTADDSPYEGKFSESAKPVFPVKTSQMFKKDFRTLRSTPFGNSYTLDLARAAVEKENLGKNGVTDFLAISFSATDAVGHQFGPNAIEVEDTYLRLDRDLASFFEFLDGKIGKGGYTVFLTADHGVSQNTSFLQSKKINADWWMRGDYEKQLNTLLEKKYGAASLVSSFLNYQVNFNYAVINKNKLDIDDIKKDCIGFLKQQPGVRDIVDMSAPNVANIVEPIRTRIINGYFPMRCGDLFILLNPSWISGYTTGAGHSVWNPYDSHIPLLWMGWGIRKGKTNAVVNMTDIAPTVAALLRIQEPNGTVGVPIRDLLQEH